MKLKQKIISAFLASACTISLCAGAVTINLAAINISDTMRYGDHLSYIQIDGDADGTFDYIEISKCDKSAEKITIPDEIDGLPVTSIGDGAFEDCTSLVSIKISDGVESIGTTAFYNCYRLTSIEIPDSVTSIEEMAFYACTGLTHITMGKGVATIEENAFYRCTKLTSINIPASVMSIKNLGCTSLKSINVAADNKNYSSIDGVLFSKDKTIVIEYPAAKTDAEFTIPNSVKQIGKKAFYYCTGLTSVKMGKNVSSIGNHAFCNCANLANIELPSRVKSIEQNTFWNCASLSSIEIPDSVTSIGTTAFFGCTDLTSITILNPDCNIYDAGSTITNGYDSNKDYYFNGTVYGYENSTAQQFANKYGYKFESLGEKPLHIKGDANDDGKLNIRDAAFISIACAKGLYDDIPIWADYNDDGKRNIRDAAAIAIYLATR